MSLDGSYLARIPIAKRSDFLVLEAAIRKLLRCEGATCSFLQSAAYIHFRTATLHCLLQAAATPDPCPIGASSFVLVVHQQDSLTVFVHHLPAAPDFAPDFLSTSMDLPRKVPSGNATKSARYEARLLNSLVQVKKD
jgi:hypothetical protein